MNIKVRDLKQTDIIENENKLMVLVNDDLNLVKNITKEEFLTNIISTTEDNALVQASDGNLYINTSTISEGLQELSDALNETNTNIGNLADLNTSDKSNLVNAINEVNTTQFDNRLHALKGYLDEGELLTDAEGLTDLKSLAHSTFDSTKFTNVGSISVTDNGLATITATNSYIKPSMSFPQTNGDWEIGIEFIANDAMVANPSSSFIISGQGGDTDHVFVQYTRDYNWLLINVIVNNTSTGSSQKIDLHQNINNYSISSGQRGKVIVGYDADNQTYYYKAYADGELKSENSVQSPYKIYRSTDIILGQYSAGFMTGNYMKGIYDLKKFYISVEGIPVFSGTQTGTDEYTINGQTVSIPYTLSKTGSKIVDSAFRTQVSAVYAQEGNTPYYTLSDTDYTLPQGELYGKIQTAYANVLPDYANGITMGFPVDITTTGSSFTAPCAGWAYIHANRGDNPGGTLRVYVNGSSVAHFVGFSKFGTSTFFPVSKGDVIFVDVDVYPSWTIGLQGFYPAKGAD